MDLWHHCLQVGLCLIAGCSFFDRQFQPDHLHSKSVFQKLLSLDDISLSAHLALMVNDDVKYKQVLVQCGPGAQVLLNLLLAVCLWVSIHLFLTLTQVFYDSA
jgi:hypothetical protein